jgi:hypothetical protein
MFLRGEAAVGSAADQTATLLTFRNSLKLLALATLAFKPPLLLHP